MSFSALGLSEAAAEIREGRVTSTELVTACLDRDCRGRARRAGVRVSRPRSCAEPGQGARRAPRPWTPNRPTARRANCHQGRVRHRRLSDRVRLTDLGGPYAPRGRSGGGDAARCRGGDHGQDGYRRVRLFSSRQDPQSARQDAHARRLVDGLARRRSPPSWYPARSARRPTARPSGPPPICGVVGFKPTHGLIPRTGALLLSRALDHVGVFARSVEDAGLLAELMAGFDGEDPDTRPIARPPLVTTAVVGATAAAALRLREIRVLGSGRAGDARRVRRAGRGAGRGGQRG